MTRSEHTTHGAIGGLIAATALAMWFLVIDGVHAQPFYTPNFLASVLLGTDAVPSGLHGLTILYTVVHYAAFVVVGVGVAWLLTLLRTGPGLLLGVVLGFLLFDLLFYASVLVTGVDVVTVLGWPEVLLGNVAAGLVLMGYLYTQGIAEPVSWGEILRAHRIMREGLVAGLVGAVAVALWFLLIDLVEGQQFFTPAALGSAVFFGARSVADVQLTAGTVLGYTVIHVGAFLITGFLFAAFANHAETHPRLVLGFVLFFVTFETLFIGLLAILAGWLLETLPWWTIAVANLIATAAMVGYLWREHPALRELMRQQGFEIENEVPTP